MAAKAHLKNEFNLNCNLEDRFFHTSNQLPDNNCDYILKDCLGTAILSGNLWLLKSFFLFCFCAGGLSAVASKWIRTLMKDGVFYSFIHLFFFKEKNKPFDVVRMVPTDTRKFLSTFSFF